MNARSPLTQEAQSALALLRREGRRFWARLLLSLCCWCLAVLLALLSISSRQGSEAGRLLPLSGALSLLILGAAALPRSRSHSLSALTRSPDVRMVGPLLDALSLAVGERRQAIVLLLTALLPQLSARDAPLLNAGQRRRLCAVLTLGEALEETAFVVAILQALEQVGDEGALPSVQRLARRRSRDVRAQPVCAAARKCLPRLLERVEKDRESQALLRAVPVSEETLLRPARGSSPSDPDQLLRSDASEP